MFYLLFIIFYWLYLPSRLFLHNFRRSGLLFIGIFIGFALYSFHFKKLNTLWLKRFQFVKAQAIW